MPLREKGGQKMDNPAGKVDIFFIESSQPQPTINQKRTKRTEKEQKAP